MIKKFFFGSSGSSKANGNASSQVSNDKQGHWDEPSQSEFKNRVPGNHSSSSTPTLKKSRTYSSGTIHESGIGQRKFSFFNNRSGSPSRSETSQNLSDNRSTRCRTPTPERISRASWIEDDTIQSYHGPEKRDCFNNAVHSFDSSDSSSHCSSNASIKMVDRYIDGEQVHTCNVLESYSSQRSQVVSGYGGGTRPIRVQYTAPVLADGVKQKPKSHSFREPKGSEQYFSTRDWVENGLEHESPRKLAKHVIERLSQSHVLPRVRSKSCVSDVPITVEDIYGEPLIESLNIDSDGSHQRKVTSFLERNCPRDNAENAEDMDMELISKSKKAEAVARILTEEFREQKFLQGGGFTVQELIQIINGLAEDKLKMACEVSAVLNDRIVERASAREELKLSRIELDSMTRESVVIQVVECYSDVNGTAVAVPSKDYNGLLPQSCTNILSTINIPVGVRWSEPFCGTCELENMTCGYKKVETLEIGCSVSSKSGLSTAAKYGISFGQVQQQNHVPHIPTTTIARLLPRPAMGLDKLTIESYPMTVLGESKRLPKPSDSTCAICLSEYKPNDTLRTIPECNHYFHSDCIDEWLKLNATCPVCRNLRESATPMPSATSLNT